MEELDVKDFFKYIISKQIIIILCIFLVVILGCIYTFKLKVPKYKSNTTIVLTTENKSNSAITQNDLTLNKSLVLTYSEIVKSKKVLNQVIKNLDLNMTVEQLNSMISVQSV